MTNLKPKDVEIVNIGLHIVCLSEYNLYLLLVYNNLALHIYIKCAFIYLI